MAKSTTFCTQLLTLVFNGTATTGLFQNGVSPLTNLYIALHTADPGVGGTQATNEIGYTPYVRATVARTSGAWAVNANTVVPTAQIPFISGQAGTSPVATYWSIGTASSGATQILWSGTISPPITTGQGVQPILTTASSVVET